METKPVYSISSCIQEVLQKCGCDDHTCTCCMECKDKEDFYKMKILLRRYRKQLLDQIHDLQDDLDCLDQLLFEIEEEIKHEIQI